MWILWLAVGIAAFLLIFSFLAMQIACRRYDAFVADLDKVLTRPIYRDCKKEILEGKAFLDAQPHEEIRISSYDGLTLVGDFYPCENARGTILMFHGWRSAPLMDCGSAAPSYHQNGLNTLLVYQRAQGKSEGKYMTFGIRERKDVHSWVKWYAERFGAEAPMLITGLSMGAASVLMACGEPFEGNVRGVLADCGFPSPDEIIKSVIRTAHLPTMPLAPLMNFWAKRLAGFGFQDYSTLEAMPKTKLPIFFAHGEADGFVPCEMTKKAYAACASEDKTLFLVPEARHGMSYILQREQYEQHIRDFINRTIP